MVDSLRDQLLKSGIVKQASPERARGPRRPGPPQADKSSMSDGRRPQTQLPRRQKSQEEMDLAKAYALRAQTEANERKRAEQAAAEQARVKRERKQKIQKLLEGKALNKAEADQPRNFEYGAKIRRVYVDTAQLVALNAGDLGVVQQAGRFLLVSREIAEQVREIDSHLLALLVDPSADGIGDDGVPDDLMW